MAGQFPRPWFRLGSMNRPTTATPVMDQPRPVPARIIRPPVIRPALVTEPQEPTTPQKPFSNTPPINKEPSPPPAQLTRPVVPLPSASASTRPAVPSPSATAPTRPVLSLPSATTSTRPVEPLPLLATVSTKPVVASPSTMVTTKSSVITSPPATVSTKSVLASPPATTTTKHHVVSSPPATVSTNSIVMSPPATVSKKPVIALPEKVDQIGSPRNREWFDKGSSKLQMSPVPSPSFTKSIPAVPSPYMSPKTKVAASPPSPLVLPPPQLKTVAMPKRESIPQEIERKTVVFQKVMEKAPTTDYSNGKIINRKQDQAKKLSHEENHQDIKVGPKGSMNGARKGMALSNNMDKDHSNTKFITMAGENRGASMEVVWTSDKNNNNNNNNDSHNFRIRESNNGNKESENEDDKNKSKKKSMESGNIRAWPMKGFFNSNVQGINNSILMDSKFAHHDPGIHLLYSRRLPAHKQADQGHH